MSKDISVVDLFCGCGGLYEGFKQAGFKASVSNDIWEPAFKTFVRNNNSTPFVLGDITDLEIKKKIIQEGKGSKVLIGGPPCQAYSMAGQRNVDDPRGKLFEDYLEIVESFFLEDDKVFNERRTWDTEKFIYRHKYSDVTGDMGYLKKM